jgi:hypothetical protein
MDLILQKMEWFAAMTWVMCDGQRRTQSSSGSDGSDQRLKISGREVRVDVRPLRSGVAMALRRAAQTAVVAELGAGISEDPHLRPPKRRT